MQPGSVHVVGPLWWAVVAVYVLAVVASVFVAFDSGRVARQERFDRVPESRWVYRIPQAAFAVLAIGVPIAVAPRWVAAIPVLAAPFIIAEQFAYLLRIVFPKSAADVDDTHE